MCECKYLYKKKKKDIFESYENLFLSCFQKTIASIASIAFLIYS